MEYNSVAEARLDLIKKYKNLQGVYYAPFAQKIWGLFAGTTDNTMSSLIYAGIRGVLPVHQFNASDLKAIQFYAGFYDERIISINELLNDEYFRTLCESDSLSENIIIDEKWSTPIRIPKGLTVKMKFEDDKKLEFKIFDLENDGNSNSHFVERQEGHYIFLNYLEPIYGLSTMAMPAISFRLADDKYTLSGICFEFFDK